MRAYAKEKKKPPVVAQKSVAAVASGVTRINTDRSEVRAILQADTAPEKKEADAADPIEVESEAKKREDQDKTPEV